MIPLAHTEHVAAAGRLGRGPQVLRALAGWTGTAAAVLATAVVLALAVGPHLLPYRVYTVVSGSMAPEIPVGSVAVVRPVRADSLRRGDVITFHRPDRAGELVTHRIVGIETGPRGRAFVTEGDANSVPDPWRVPAAGAGMRLAFAVPYLGYGLTALQVPIARLALGTLLGLVAAAAVLRRIWRPRPAVERAG